MRRLCSLAVLVTLTTAALAADRPVAGDRLSLKDPAGESERPRAFKFKAGRDPAVDPGRAAPTRASVGATLEVIGANPGDGTTGPITLPAGAVDRARQSARAARATSSRTRAHRRRQDGDAQGRRATAARLSITGGGSDWPYAVTQPQGTIDVRLTVGGDVYCARFTSFRANEAGQGEGQERARAGRLHRPPPPVCGNGVRRRHRGVRRRQHERAATAARRPARSRDASALCAGVPTASPARRSTPMLVSPAASRGRCYVTAPPLDPNRLFVVEQDGRIRIVQERRAAARRRSSTSRASVSCCGEHGLLGIAFPPDYETNGCFFVNYTNNAGDTVVAPLHGERQSRRRQPRRGTLILDDRPALRRTTTAARSPSGPTATSTSAWATAAAAATRTRTART